MTIPRSEQINLDATPYYHIVSRCVRRTFLCGEDRETRRDYSHRKLWIINRLKFLSKVFAIDIAAYAIMSNHYHVVLHVNHNLTKAWDDEEIFERGSKLFPQKTKKLEAIIEINPTLPIISETINEWRSRLFDISWFMRCMNEPIARLSNIEDNCKGHFWEGRFKSQALLDEGAVLSAMIYVDLNPIRAGASATPEDSDFTSIQERIKTYNKSKLSVSIKPTPQPTELMPFKDLTLVKPNANSFIDLKLEDYFRLVDETGRIIRHDKRGAINPNVAPILDRLNLCPDKWISFIESLESKYAYAVGHEDVLATFSPKRNMPKGLKTSRQLYGIQAA